MILDNNPYSGGPFASSFTIDFADDTSAFGMGWFGANAVWSIALYNDTTGHLGTLSVYPESYYMYIGARDPASLISYATISHRGGDWVDVDNLSYVSGEVPEPSTMLLLAFALTCSC